MEQVSNEVKARKIANNNCTHICLADCSAESYFSSENDCYKAALEAMSLKDKEWAERFKKAFEGIWTASFNVDYQSSKTETTIEFKLVERE